MIDEHAHPFALEAGQLDLSHVTLDLVDAPWAAERREQLRPTFLWNALLRARLADRLGVQDEEVEAARADLPAKGRDSFSRSGSRKGVPRC